MGIDDAAPAVPAQDSDQSGDPRPSLTGSEARGASRAAAWIARSIGRLIAAQPPGPEDAETRRLLTILKQECGGWSCRWSVEAGPLEPANGAGGEVAEVLAFFDALIGNAGYRAEHVAPYRAAVEAMARDNERLAREAEAWKEAGKREARAHLRVSSEAATLRARVAELTAELAVASEARDLWMAQGQAKDRHIEAAELRVAELEARNATLDGRLVEAVNAVPTSAGKE